MSKAEMTNPITTPTEDRTRPKRPTGDYFNADEVLWNYGELADSYMDTLEVEIASLRPARPQSGLSAGDREKLCKVRDKLCMTIGRDERDKQNILDAHSDIYEVLSSAPTEGWISVEDRLPGELSDVLVSTHDGNVTSGGSFAGGEWFTREGHPWHEQYMSPITHWMPLPEPPLLDRLAGKGK